MRIRKGRYGELGVLNAVARSSDELFRGTHLEWAIDDSASDEIRFKRALAEDTLWVAEVDGRPVGFACAHATETTLYVDQLSVGREFQGRGIGRRLMETAIGYTRSRHPAVSLITDRQIPWNMPFYESLGFIEWTDPDASVQREWEDEISDGFDPATRIAMIMRFR